PRWAEMRDVAIDEVDPHAIKRVEPHHALKALLFIEEALKFESNCTQGIPKQRGCYRRHAVCIADLHGCIAKLHALDSSVARHKAFEHSLAGLGREIVNQSGLTEPSGKLGKAADQGNVALLGGTKRSHNGQGRIARGKRSERTRISRDVRRCQKSAVGLPSHNA